MFLVLLAILAGAVLPFQAVFNVQLGKTVQQPIFAAFASFLIGTLCLFLYLLIIKFDFSTVVQTQTANSAVWLAGVLGAFYVAAVIVLAPKLGTALTFGLVVTGQMLVSITLDHYGFLGLPIKELNWQRCVGVLLLLAGIVVIRKW